MRAFKYFACSFVLSLAPLLNSTVAQAQGLTCEVVVNGVTMTVPCTPTGTPPDYSKLLQAILDSENLLLKSQQSLLVVSKDTDQQVTSMNKTFAQTLGTVGMFVGKYIAPAIVSFLAAKGKL